MEHFHVTSQLGVRHVCVQVVGVSTYRRSYCVPLACSMLSLRKGLAARPVQSRTVSNGAVRSDRMLQLFWP